MKKPVSLSGLSDAELLAQTRALIAEERASVARLGWDPLEEEDEEEEVVEVEGGFKEIRFVADNALLAQFEEIRELLAPEHPNLSMGEMLKIMVDTVLSDLEAEAAEEEE